MKLLLLLLICAQARAADMPDLELLRGMAADHQETVDDERTKAPQALAAPATREYSGDAAVAGNSPSWRRPKEALKDRSVLLEDGRTAWLKDSTLARTLIVGAQAWIKGLFSDPKKDGFHQNSKMIDVVEATVFPKGLSAQAETASVSVQIAEVSPWSFGANIGKSKSTQALVVETRLANKTGQPITVAIKKVFLSFDAKKAGSPVSGLSARGRDGMPSGATTAAIDSGSTIRLQWRGDGMYPAGHGGQKLYVTLELAAGDEALFVRGSGEVTSAQ